VVVCGCERGVARGGVGGGGSRGRERNIGREGGELREGNFSLGEAGRLMKKGYSQRHLS